MSATFMRSFIRNTQNPCIRCVHYLKFHVHNRDTDIEQKIGICHLFGKQHLVTGEIIYEDALACRINDSKCGQEGRYFTSKNIL